MIELTQCRATCTQMLAVSSSIRIGLVARICRSHSSKEDQNRQGRGSIPRFGNYSFAVQPCQCLAFDFWSSSAIVVFLGYFGFDEPRGGGVLRALKATGSLYGEPTNEQLLTLAELNVIQTIPQPIPTIAEAKCRVKLCSSFVGIFRVLKIAPIFRLLSN